MARTITRAKRFRGTTSVILARVKVADGLAQTKCVVRPCVLFSLYSYAKGMSDTTTLIKSSSTQTKTKSVLTYDLII